MKILHSKFLIRLVFLKSEFHLLNRHLVESSKSVGVEHACIEVDALVPAKESEGPLLVNVVSTGTVVVSNDILPV